MPRPVILLFAEADDSWHVSRLVRAFDAAGATPTVVSLRQIDIAVGPGAWGLSIPGLAGPPDAALVRTVAGGVFEAVTLRLGVLHALSHLGVPVANSATAIERCVDKSMTTFLLHRAGLPTPPTRATESPDRAAAFLVGETGAGHTIVQKPLFGSQGRLLRRLGPGETPEAMDGVHYLQRFIDGGADGYRDWRVFVVGGRAVATMMRVGRDWITNVKQGGRCVAVTGDGELETLGVAAAAAVGADYAGVDIIRDRHGQPFVLEVNSMPAWQGLQGVTGRSIAAALADHVLTRVRRAAFPLAGVSDRAGAC